MPNSAFVQITTIFSTDVFLPARTPEYFSLPVTEWRPFEVNQWWTVSARRATITDARSRGPAGGTLVLYDLIMLGVVVACLFAIHFAFDAMQRRNVKR